MKIIEQYLFKYHQIIIFKILLFEDHRIGKFSNNNDFRKLEFFSEEKISERSHFVMILIWFYYLVSINTYLNFETK